LANLAGTFPRGGAGRHARAADPARGGVPAAAGPKRMSPLAAAIYTLLCSRLSQADPRITYAELAEQLREQSEDFEHIYHRSRELYAALGEVGRACRRLRLPPLPALVVRADTRRPGAAYYAGKTGQPGERIAAWRRDLEAVCATVYPKKLTTKAQRTPRRTKGRQEE